MTTASSPRLPVLIDTNLFVLFVVGRASIGLIGRHKRLRDYSDRDFIELGSMLSNAERVLITPNVASECSNLAAQIGGPARDAIRDSLREVVGTVVEIYVDSRSATLRSEYSRLGLTDSGILDAMDREHAVVLTADVGLYLAASNIDCNRAINFNHIRQNYLF